MARAGIGQSNSTSRRISSGLSTPSENAPHLDNRQKAAPASRKRKAEAEAQSADFDIASKRQRTPPSEAPVVEEAASTLSTPTKSKRVKASNKTTKAEGSEVGGLVEAKVLTEEEVNVESPSKKRQRKTTATAVKEEEVEPIGTNNEAAHSVDKQSKKKQAKASPRSKKDVAVKVEEPTAPKSANPSRITKAKVEKEATIESAGVDSDTVADASQPTDKPKRKPRKTKEEKEAEAMPLAARTVGSKLYIGAHVSAAGGVHNSITNAVHIGANAFALFLKSQRKWENPALKDEHRDSFKSMSIEHQYHAHSHVVPHGSYLVNLAAKDPDKAKQAYDCFLDDLQRCEALGIKLYNFHPGNTNGEPRSEALARIANQLNTVHKKTSTVTTLLENMAAANNTIGGVFSDLRAVIDLIDDKSRVGVCLDTCHAFAAGYDLRTPEAFRATLAEFDEVVGAKYLKAVHLNDSKAPFNSRKDLHYNIGLGFLGLRSFWNMMNEPRFWGIPLVLETPIDEKDAEGKVVEDKGVWAREIKLLESLVGMDAEGDEFKRMEKELWEKGVKERERLQEVVDRKGAERDKKAAKAEAKGTKRKKKVKDEDSASSGLSEAESV